MKKHAGIHFLTHHVCTFRNHCAQQLPNLFAYLKWRAPQIFPESVHFPPAMRMSEGSPMNWPKHGLL